jgi:hypothetical protein
LNVADNRITVRRIATIEKQSLASVTAAVLISTGALWQAKEQLL